MKKQFLLLGLAVAAMTSCTNDEVLDQVQPVQKAIGFEAFTNKATRAVTETVTPTISSSTGDDGSTNHSVSGLNKFYVFGYYNTANSGVENVFTNVPVTGSVGEVTTTENDQTTTKQVINWIYTDNEEGLKYWTQNQYMFAAYADQNTSSQITTAANNVTAPTVGFENGTLTFTDYTVSDDKDLVADVVSKDNKSFGAYNEKVAFSFKHMLTKIYFQIQNSDTKYRMRITNPLTISGVKNQGTGTVNMNAINWVPTTNGTTRNNFTPTGKTETNITNNVFTATTGVWTSEEYFVMPQTVSGITFSITAEFIDEKDQVVTTKTFTNEAFNVTTVNTWSNGTVYCYTISLPTAAKPIVFDVASVAGWTSYGSSIELNPNDEDAQNP